MTVRSEGNRISLDGNGVLEVIDSELAEALEMNSQGGVEVVKTVGPFRVTKRSEVNCIPQPQNGLLEVTEFAELLETSEKRKAEVVNTAGPVRAIVAAEC